MEYSPDYSKYSTEDLFDVAAHINREQFPERYAVVVEEIKRRVDDDPSSLERYRSVTGGAAVVGAVVGSILYTIFTFSFHQIFTPRVTGDGQYGMMIFLTLPVGAVIGAITAVVSALNIDDSHRASTLARSTGLPILIFIVFLLIYNGKTWFARDPITSIMFLFPLLGMPLLWAALLLIGNKDQKRS